MAHFDGAKIELHILQNFPPHNLNRDDTGAPKDTEFGGERRGRISSQCLKRSIRFSHAFEHEVARNVAVRTKLSAGRLASILSDTHQRNADDAQLVARAAISKLVANVGDDGKTSVLFYVGNDELERLAHGLEGAWSEIAPAILEQRAAAPVESNGDAKPKRKQDKGKKAADGALDSAVAPIVADYLKKYDGRIASADIALFGRMLAEQPTLNVDAACHVAHAISTNRTVMEFDYFTAVDDLQQDDETGAGMIGTTMYNSSCFYRYAVIDTAQLMTNLPAGQDAAELAAAAIRGFIRGSIEAVPSGKQASTAAYTPPSFVMAVVRPEGSMPVSLANAFEAPARPRDGRGLVAESIRKLDQHWKDLVTMYGERGAIPFVLVQESVDTLENLSAHRCTTVEELIQNTAEASGAAVGLGGLA